MTFYCVGVYESKTYPYYPYTAAPILVVAGTNGSYTKVNYSLSRDRKGFDVWERTSQTGRIREMSFNRAGYVVCNPIPFRPGDLAIAVSTETIVVVGGSDSALHLLGRLVRHVSGPTFAMQCVRLVLARRASNREYRNRSSLSGPTLTSPETPMAPRSLVKNRDDEQTATQ